MDRHARQAQLTGVGASGQARILRATAEVCLEGLAADVAARYLAGAGFSGLRVRSEELAAGARALDASARVDVDPSLAVVSDTVDLDDPSARDLARGALAALQAIRGVLEEPS